MKIPFLFTAALLTLAPFVSSPVLARPFTYQGELRTASGPVAGICDFQFYLFAGSTGGTALDSDTVAGLTVSDGLFTVELDFGPGSFNGSERWLETRVKCGSDTAFTTLPRQQITASPYAITSFSTEGLQGIPVSDTAPANAQVLKYNGTSGEWEPADDIAGSGDITAVNANDGLDGGGNVGDVNLSVNPGEFLQLQTREVSIDGAPVGRSHGALYTTMTCGGNTTAIAGGAGHRDDNDAALDIVSGSAPLDNNTWLFTVWNADNGSSRAVTLWLLCMDV